MPPKRLDRKWLEESAGRSGFKAAGADPVHEVVERSAFPARAGSPAFERVVRKDVDMPRNRRFVDARKGGCDIVARGDLDDGGKSVRVGRRTGHDRENERPNQAGSISHADASSIWM
jgi:hypothetical protein